MKYLIEYTTQDPNIPYTLLEYMVIEEADDRDHAVEQARDVIGHNKPFFEISVYLLTNRV